LTHNFRMKKEYEDDFLLDKFDLSLLAALQNDAQATHQALGDRVHLSASQVSRRIARLHASGIIRRYVALLDPAMVLGRAGGHLCHPGPQQRQRRCHL
jgi:Lrp/AsnC family leucine-responsive transcriptional regulator